MATRTRPIYEATRLAERQLAEIGREIRLARIGGGMRQSDLARAIGTSTARVSQLERGRLTTLSYLTLAKAAAVAGLKLWLRAFPAARRLLDAPQLELFAKLRAHAHLSWEWDTEVPMPILGDLRAADCRARIPGCTIIFELWTRLSDWQAQSRAARLKKRDLGADRLIIVLKRTRANREALAAAGPESLDAFPMRTREVLAALKEGRDPGADGIVLL